MSPVRTPEETRMKILETALDLFHRGSFTGTSINQIVDKAGITKGALFHYFKGKNELGYAVVEECLRRQIQEHWITPLATSVDPINDMLAILDKMSQMLVDEPHILECGCPLNNLSQEMSSLDDTFRLKLLELYREWELAIEKSIRAGIDAGNVRSDVDPESASSAIVALLEGSIGMIKAHQNMEYVSRVGQGITHFLLSLKP